MTEATLDQAKRLSEKIKHLQTNIKALELACSESYKERDMLLSISGHYTESDSVTIPENISKTICKIALLELNEKLRLLNKIFESL